MQPYFKVQNRPRKISVKEGRFLLRGVFENLLLCFSVRATKFADLFDPWMLWNHPKQFYLQTFIWSESEYRQIPESFRTSVPTNVPAKNISSFLPLKPELCKNGHKGALLAPIPLRMNVLVPSYGHTTKVLGQVNFQTHYLKWRFC